MHPLVLPPVHTKIVAISGTQIVAIIADPITNEQRRKCLSVLSYISFGYNNLCKPSLAGIEINGTAGIL